ncbi:MAG: gamma-glutamyl-gamma-aminobutyrate hydrolase family protein [Oscillospiraceae bacterium]|nr:gamma-glutamyl-gamma-aminobutyrate hydrolase family protein [Oscillospiraceae bacterium]
MRPVIITVGEDGNTGRYYRNSMLSLAYSDAVSAAGGLPAAALDNRHPEDYVAVADGLLLSGGQDLACGTYGELRPLKYDYPISSRMRDTFELALCRLFLEAGKPILGIGRGMQVINVALGGKLYQDIQMETGRAHPDESAASHRNDGITKAAEFSFHPIRTVEGTKTAAILGETVEVSSCHHQAVKTLGTGLKAAAFAPDGIIEAIEHECLPVLGMQFHPERDAGAIKADPRMFEAFIRLCGEVAK